MKKEAINWNSISDIYIKEFWDQNIKQFWVDEEIDLSQDIRDWQKLSVDEKVAFEKILVGLTLLDTVQGNVGMPNLIQHEDSLHAKAVFSFMGAMEQMHAKSYSTIFSTLSHSNRIDELFEIAKNDIYLQKKIALIIEKYSNITTRENFAFALAASVMLETFLFYSGFFYPLYFSGRGKLVGSGEIISLIIRDESIHGLFTGKRFQDLFSKFNIEEKKKLKKEIIDLTNQLYEIENDYIESIYEKVNLSEQVKIYIKYNANKALINLGFDRIFNIKESDVNPIIFNGIDTNTKTHDFFSTKGNGYVKALNVERLEDEDFEF